MAESEQRQIDFAGARNNGALFFVELPTTSNLAIGRPIHR
jgi:hypothetical protein